MIDRVQSQFKLDNSVVSSLSRQRSLRRREAEEATSQERYREWRKRLPAKLQTPEYLVPRILRDIRREPPAWETQRGHTNLSKTKLRELVRGLGPWRVPFRLGQGLQTMRGPVIAPRTRDRILFRRELITGTTAAILGDELADTTVLDIGCNCGFFSLDIAARGAKHVDGVDLRPENIAQARFIAEHFGIDNVRFDVADALNFGLSGQWDVVLNLGVLYHVTQPLEFMRQTYALCRRFAIIDTLCREEAMSAYVLLGGKDVSKPTEGREHIEFHPTYRGAIDTIRYAGFSEVLEIVGTANPPHDLYEKGSRRCFLAVK